MKFLWLGCVALALVVLWLMLKLRQAQRIQFIRQYRFSKGLLAKLQSSRSGLTEKDSQLVARALREFFLAHLACGRQFVSMPSQVTDELWHEFILYTRNYQAFCQQAFGRFLHHTPAVALMPQQASNVGLRRTWWYCCKEENINPSLPTRLPLLFAIDAKLGIAGGFYYVPDCAALRQGGDGSLHCGADFGSSSFDGCTEGFGPAEGDALGGDAGGGDGECGGD